MSCRPTREQCAKAVSGVAAMAEHDAFALHNRGFHGEQLAEAAQYAITLRRAAQLLGSTKVGRAEELAQMTRVSITNTNDTGRFTKSRS